MLVILAALFVIAPMNATGQSGGGEVSNVLPTVEAFTNDEGVTARNGVTDVFQGVIKDDNGEQDVQTIRIQVANATTATLSTDVSAVDWDTVTSEPAEFSSGWKVWSNGGTRNGEIAFKAQYTFGTTGTFEFTVDAEDQVGYGSADGPISVDVTNAITIHAHPVNADGTDDTDALWGGWAAAPGATDVGAVNYVKVSNTGDVGTQDFTVDFTGAEFVGANDASFEIGVDSNIRFSCAETQTGQNPADLTFSMEAVSGTGSITCAFTEGSELGTGDIFVKYQIESIDAPMAVQAYEASYTVSA